MPEMFPGQFVQILVKNSPNVFLRRPVSINNVDLANNELWLLVKRVGEGTEKICKSSTGDIMNLIFPLGNSFTIPEEKCTTLLIGGELVLLNAFLGKNFQKRVTMSISFWVDELHRIFCR